MKIITGHDMASWYVWNAMGLYPYTHGDGVYAISSPIFDKVELTMGGWFKQ